MAHIQLPEGLPGIRGLLAFRPTEIHDIPLGEIVIRLAAHIRSLGHACRVEHPIGDSDLLQYPGLRRP